MFTVNPLHYFLFYSTLKKCNIFKINETNYALPECDDTIKMYCHISMFSTKQIMTMVCNDVSYYSPPVVMIHHIQQWVGLDDLLQITHIGETKTGQQVKDSVTVRPKQ